MVLTQLPIIYLVVIIRHFRKSYNNNILSHSVTITQFINFIGLQSVYYEVLVNVFVGTLLLYILVTSILLYE